MKYAVRWEPSASAPERGTHSVLDTQTGRIVKTYPEVADCMAWTQYAAEAECYRRQLEVERLERTLERETLLHASRSQLMGFVALVDVMRVPS